MKPFLTLLLGVTALVHTAGAVQAQFAPAITYSGGVAPTGIATGDIDGDGHLDIVTINDNVGTVTMLMGPVNSGRVFLRGAATGLGTSAAPMGLKLGDVNGDGRLDIVVAKPDNGAVSVLLGQANSGSGFFAPATLYSTNASTAAGPLSLALGDMNGDGRLDIVTSNMNGNTVSVLLGQASGGFANASLYAVDDPSTVNAWPNEVALGDVNRDGRLDIVTVNPLGRKASVLLGQASGGFAAVAHYSVGTGVAPMGLALGDLNGDGYLDIVAGNSLLFASTISVLLGQATGGFAAATSYPIGIASFGVSLGDVNGDGRLDIAAASANSGTVGVLLGQAGGGFSPVTSYVANLSNRYVDNIALADLNADGRLDIAVPNGFDNQVSILFNTTALATQPAAAQNQPLVTVSPNPTQGAAQVQLSITNLPAAASQLDATLVNILGQVVGQVSFKPSQSAANATLPTAGLAGGVYLVQLYARNAQGQSVGSLSTQRLALY